MRLVCVRWYAIHLNRNKWKFWNSISLVQIAHEKGIATVPVLPNRKWHGRLFAYVGAQKVPYSFCDYEMGEKHGVSMFFFRNTGQLQIESHWHRGQLHGHWKEFSLIGKLLRWKQYLNGKLHGHERTYDPVTGSLRNDLQWFSGRRHGVAKTWRWDTGEEKPNRYFVLGVEMADLETYLRMSAALPRPID